MQNRNIVPTPAWIKDLIIYEIAPKGFTSPNGAESGTFKSLKDKMEYLHELGITGIWLAGHQLCRSGHFYNIWNQYACIRPDELAPSLGTPEEFKELIDEAHRCGIKVFLDVITHGVLSDSPLVSEKPHWFKGGSWNMTDYDWFGGHKDLDEWWVNTWLGYIRDFGVDGFRLDVSAYRYDLWSEIRNKARDIGHEIVIFHELWPGKTGATDFLQTGSKLGEVMGSGVKKDFGLLNNVAGFVKDEVERNGIEYRVIIIYEDGTIGENKPESENALTVTCEGLSKEIKTDNENYAYWEQRETLYIGNVCADKAILDIIIMAGEKHFMEGFGEYQEYRWHKTVDDAIKTDGQLTCEGEAPTLKVSFPVALSDGQFISVQLSSHDCGWENFPQGSNPYMAQGSRFVFGYGFMLVPAVPLFMSGEEFDADYVPLPTLSPKLYGGEDSGKGTWLYGSWLQWDQLQIKSKHDMLQDVKKMIRIRKQEAELIHPFLMGETNTALLKMDYESAEVLPIPYMYHGTEKMVLVAGNPYTDRDIKIRFKMPEELMNTISQDESFKVSDLWNEKEIGVMTVHEFEKMEWTVLKDKSANGGLLVLEIRRT